LWPARNACARLRGRLGWNPWGLGHISFADSWNEDWPQLKAFGELAD
jgi:hypothetical protein